MVLPSWIDSNSPRDGSLGSLLQIFRAPRWVTQDSSPLDVGGMPVFDAVGAGLQSSGRSRRHEEVLVINGQRGLRFNGFFLGCRRDRERHTRGKRFKLFLVSFGTIVASSGEGTAGELREARWRAVVTKQ